MKYLVCSDLHGDEETFKKLLKIKEKLNCDTILSAGDFTPTLEMELLASNTDFRTVMGNMDRYHSLSILSEPRDFISFSLGERKVVVTHGDHYSPFNFELKKGDIFISGHTHRSMLEKGESGVILFNPGSASRPRDGKKSFGVLEEEKITLLSFPFCFRLKELIL